MSKNRLRQKANKRKYAALRARKAQADGDCIPGTRYEFKIQKPAPKDAVPKKDCCGVADLTGYNAIRLVEDPEWTIIFK